MGSGGAPGPRGPYHGALPEPETPMRRAAPFLALALVATASAALPAWSEDRPTRPRVLMKTSMGDVTIELFADEAPKTVANFLALAEGQRTWKDPETGKDRTGPFFDGLAFHRVIDHFMIQGGCPRCNGMGDPGYTFEDEINAECLGLDKLKAIDARGQPHPWLLIRSQLDFQQQILGPFLRQQGVSSQEELERRATELDAALKQLTLKDVYELQGYRYTTEVRSSPPTKGVIAMANSGPSTNGSQFFINLEDTPHLTGKHTVFGRVVEGMDVVERIGKVKVDASSKPLEPVTILSIRRLP